MTYEKGGSSGPKGGEVRRGRVLATERVVERRHRLRRQVRDRALGLLLVGLRSADGQAVAAVAFALDIRGSGRRHFQRRGAGRRFSCAQESRVAQSGRRPLGRGPARARPRVVGRRTYPRPSPVLRRTAPASALWARGPRGSARFLRPAQGRVAAALCLIVVGALPPSISSMATENRTLLATDNGTLVPGW